MELAGVTHRYEIMDKGSNSGHFWRDPEVLEVQILTKWIANCCENRSSGARTRDGGAAALLFKLPPS